MKIRIKETLQKDIEANDIDEVIDEYRNEDIILTSDNYTGTVICQVTKNGREVNKKYI